MPTPSDTRLWEQHLSQESRARSREALRNNAKQAVTERLQHAELRHDLATRVLADVADNPESATDEDKANVAAELRRLAVIAPGQSATAAQDAIRTVGGIQHTADRETTLAAARQALATAIVTGAIDETGTESITSDATQRWLDALETLLPTDLAVDRAAAIAAARSAAVERRVAVQHRHPDVDLLLASEENSDWEIDSARLG